MGCNTLWELVQAALQACKCKIATAWQGFVFGEHGAEWKYVPHVHQPQIISSQLGAVQKPLQDPGIGTGHRRRYQHPQYPPLGTPTLESEGTPMRSLPVAEVSFLVQSDSIHISLARRAKYVR